MAAKWLFKQEPDTYSFSDLVKDKKTTWDGVNNPLAKKYLRQIKKGDVILFYHTGKEKQIVGEMIAVASAKPDPNSDDANAVCIEVKASTAWESPLTLTQIKADPQLADWELVRISRLSVMPITDEQWKALEALKSRQ